MSRFSPRALYAAAAVLILVGAVGAVLLLGSDEESGAEPPEQILMTEGGDQLEGNASAGATGAGSGEGDGSASGSGAGEGEGDPGGGSAPAPPGQDQPTDPAGTVPPGGDEGDDRVAVRKAVRAYLIAISRNQGRTACAQMTAAGRRSVIKKVTAIVPEVGPAGCEGAVILYRGAYGPGLGDPEVTAIEVSGSRATAVGPLEQEATLIKRNEVWLLTDYGQ